MILADGADEQLNWLHRNLMYLSLLDASANLSLQSGDILVEFANCSIITSGCRCC